MTGHTMTGSDWVQTPASGHREPANILQPAAVRSAVFGAGSGRRRLRRFAPGPASPADVLQGPQSPFPSLPWAVFFANARPFPPPPSAGGTRRPWPRRVWKGRCAAPPKTPRLGNLRVAEIWELSASREISASRIWEISASRWRTPRRASSTPAVRAPKGCRASARQRGQRGADPPRPPQAPAAGGPW